MGLAHAIGEASAEEVQALADYLLGQFEMVTQDVTTGQPRPSVTAGVASAIIGWGYMTRTAQDLGD